MARIGQHELESQAARFLASLERSNPSAGAFVRMQIDPASAPPRPPDPPKKTQAKAPAPVVSRNASSHAPTPKQHHRRGPRLDRAQRRREQARRLRDREGKHLAALTARVAAIGGTPIAIRGIPMAVWSMCLQVMADATGRAARIWMRRHSNRAAVGVVLAAALGRVTPTQTEATAEVTEEVTPTDARSWASLRTRRIAALGLALLYLSRRTHRDGPWGAVVIGIPRGALAALLRDPYDTTASATPHITALFGTHRTGADPLTSSQVGYFVTLAAHGFAYRQQLPANEAQRTELWGPSGYAFNRYWLPTERDYTIDDEDTRALFGLLRALADDDAQALSRAPRATSAPPTTAAPPN